MSSIVWRSIILSGKYDSRAQIHVETRLSLEVSTNGLRFGMRTQVNAITRLRATRWRLCVYLLTHMGVSSRQVAWTTLPSCGMLRLDRRFSHLLVIRLRSSHCISTQMVTNCSQVVLIIPPRFGTCAQGSACTHLRDTRANFLAVSLTSQETTASRDQSTELAVSGMLAVASVSRCSAGTMTKS